MTIRPIPDQVDRLRPPLGQDEGEFEGLAVAVPTGPAAAHPIHHHRVMKLEADLLEVEPLAGAVAALPLASGGLLPHHPDDHAARLRQAEQLLGDGLEFGKVERLPAVAADLAKGRRSQGHVDATVGQPPHPLDAIA